MVKKEDLFVPVNVVLPIPEIALPFKAENAFFGKSEVEVAYYGTNFTNWFRSKVEENVPKDDPVPVDLKRSATDREIVDALGGEEKAEVTLAEIWRLLLRQPKGEFGHLLVNERVNLFYVRDVNNILRVVFVYRYDDSWSMSASTVIDRRWHDGYRVFSRNS